jgi:5-methylcytosine-specific restriction endonuclease McrA
MPHKDPEKRRECLRRYPEAHREEAKQRCREWYAANRERARAQQKEYYERNAEHMRTRSRAWAEQNQKRVKQNQKAWYAANRQAVSNANARYREAHRDELNAYLRGWRKNNKDKTRAWVESHREQLRENWRRKVERIRNDPVRYEAARQRFKELNRRWLERNPEKALLKSVRRRAAKRQAETGDSKAIEAFYEEVRSATRIDCHYCHVAIPKGKRHVDHAVPLARGGAHCVTNLVVACPTCNLSKGTKLPTEFIPRRAAC